EVAASTSMHAKTILVIEDEGAVRRLVTDILSQAGYVVLEASGGQEALALSREFVGEIDLVVSDVVMPTMNGPQVAEELARVRPGIRVMFMSGYTEDSVIPRGPLDARAPFILKPFTPDEFAEKVREALAETARG
ncbi:MAG: response regulator, partial [Blastocatellia bacterium]